MSGVPVFQNRFELRMWRRLGFRGPTAVAGMNRKNTAQVLDKILQQEGTVTSALLVALIDRMEQDGIADAGNLAKVVGRSRAVDCLPSVRASEVMLRKGDIDAATDLLSQSSRSPDVFNRALAAARIALARDDVQKAVDGAMRAFGVDPSAMGPYEVLEKADPAGGWAQRRQIAIAIAGGDPGDPGGSDRMRELVSIYREWFSGNRERASEILASSEYYTKSDPEFLLASARISADEGDHISVSKMYSRITQNAPSYILCEAARSLMELGRAQEAADLLASADRHCQAAMRGTIEARAMGAQGDLMEAVRTYLDDEGSGTDEVVWVFDLLMRIGMRDQAVRIQAALAAVLPKDPTIHILESCLRMDSGDLAGALVAANRAVRADPRSIPPHIQKGRVQLEMGRMDAASRSCEIALGMSSTDLDAMALSRDIRLAEGNPERAAAACRRLLDIYPEDPETLRVMGSAMSELDERNDARFYFRKASRCEPTLDGKALTLSKMMESGLYPEVVMLADIIMSDRGESPVLLRLRGNAEYCQGQYMKASLSYASAAKLAPHDARIWHSKGMADEARGDMESAEESYDRALLLDLGEPAHWISKSAAQEARGDYHGAVESLNRAIELDPSSVYPLVRKAMLFASDSRMEESLHYLDMAAAITPGDLEIPVQKVRILMDSGEYRLAIPVAESFFDTERRLDSALFIAECMRRIGSSGRALPYLDSALSDQPRSVDLLRSKARVMADMGDYQNATTICKRLTDISPEDPEIREFVEEISSSARREKAAAEEEARRKTEEDARRREEARAAEAVARAPPEPAPPKQEEDAGALHQMAVSLMEAGDLRGALRNAEKAHRMEPVNPDHVLLKARISYEMGDLVDARATALAAVRQKPDDPEVHILLGRIKHDVNDMDGAVEEFEKAEALGSDSPDIHEVMGRIYDGKGDVPKAIKHLSKAFAASHSNKAVGERLVRLRLSVDDTTGARRDVDIMCSEFRTDAEVAVLSAEVAVAASDDESMVAAFNMFRECETPGAETTVKMVRLLEESGHREEASILLGGRSSSEAYDKTVKRAAEKVLRRSYTTKVPFTDPDVLQAVDVDEQMAEKIITYLSEVGDCGPTQYGTESFEEMESRARDIIIKCAWKDLESNPVMPLEKVFVQGGCHSADEARRMVSYIHKVMVMDPGRRSEPRLEELSMKLSGDETIYEVMVTCGVGIYEARVIKALVSSPSSRTS